MLINITDAISIAQCKTAVSPLLTPWRYYRLALSYRYGITGNMESILVKLVVYPEHTITDRGYELCVHGCSFVDTVSTVYFVIWKWNQSHLSMCPFHIMKYNWGIHFDCIIAIILLPKNHFWSAICRTRSTFETHCHAVDTVSVTEAINIPYKQRVLMHRHQGLNVRHGLCHIYMRYLYIYIYMSCL